jgi:2'-5' RNA ligase
MGNDARRLFFAITPDGPTVVALGRLLDALRQASAGRNGSLRWVEPGRLHLTLQFLAHVPDAWLGELEALGARVAAAEPVFDVVFDALGGFPSLERARVLWLGVQAGEQPLGRLAAALAAGLDALGLPVEPRSFTPHLTLARSREPRAGQPLRDRVPVPAGLGFRARELVLYESRLGAGPAQYVPLNRARFG